MPAVEAAHIRPWAQGGTHETFNGLPLRRDLHRLFDSVTSPLALTAASWSALASPQNSPTGGPITPWRVSICAHPTR